MVATRMRRDKAGLAVRGEDTQTARVGNTDTYILFVLSHLSVCVSLSLFFFSFCLKHSIEEIKWTKGNKEREGEMARRGCKVAGLVRRTKCYLFALSQSKFEMSKEDCVFFLIETEW